MSSFLSATAAPGARSAPFPITTCSATAAPTAGMGSRASSYGELTEGRLSARSSVADFDVANLCGEDLSKDQAHHAQLGYKDELEVRFIWDRVLGKGQHGTSTRVVIDRFTGQEYACKKMPKRAPRDLLPDNASSDEIADADAQQVDHIRREISLFTKLRSSLNVAKLEQVYEDSDNVYLVMEKCDGPTLAEVSEAGPVTEADVSTYMRSVVRTIVQCHDENEVHAGVEPSKFMLLTEDRQSPVKATGFGRPGGILRKLTNIAPEMFSKMPSGVGKNADTWAAGIMATRLLTEYFPFDDVLSNVVDCTGVLAPLAPVTSVLDENPLMPSGAALFVSAMVMLLDFSRPKWQPVTAQAKDFVVKCLDMNAARRWTSREALSHPWLQRLKPRAGSDGDVPAGVVQRIQRFGSFNEFKRAALENIAERCLKQSMGLRSGAAGAASGLAAAAAADPTPGAPSSADASASDAPRTPAKHAAGVTRTDNVADVSSQAHAHGDAATAAGPVAPHAASAAVDAQGNVGGGGARGADVGAAAAQGAEVVADVVGTGSPGIGKAKRLLKHMMVTDGTIDRFTLADGLETLGYDVPEGDLEHLLEQLSAVPGLTTSTAVTSASLAASQLDAAASPEEWRVMARAAFDALDLDGDGKVHREEMASLLAGRCPKDEIDEAVSQAITEAGLPADADSLDHEAFLQLVTADSSPSAAHSMTKFPSMAQQDPWAVPSFSGMLKRACSTTLRRYSCSGSACVDGGSCPEVVVKADAGEDTPAGAGDVVPLKVAVGGILKEEVGCIMTATHRARIRSRGENVHMPCMDAALASAELQPVGEDVYAAKAAQSAGAGGGGGGNPALPMEVGGDGGGGGGGRREEVAADSSRDGDDDDALAKQIWGASRVSKDRIRRMFQFPGSPVAAYLEAVAETGSGDELAEREGSSGFGTAVLGGGATTMPQFA